VRIALISDMHEGVDSVVSLGDVAQGALSPWKSWAIRDSGMPDAEQFAAQWQGA